MIDEDEEVTRIQEQTSGQVKAEQHFVKKKDDSPLLKAEPYKHLSLPLLLQPIANFPHADQSSSDDLHKIYNGVAADRFKLLVEPLSKKHDTLKLLYGPEDLNTAEQKLITANKRRWSHMHTGSYLLKTMSVSNEAIVQALTEHEKPATLVDRVYSSFFKSICECPLLPLTTDHFPAEL